MKRFQSVERFNISERGPQVIVPFDEQGLVEIGEVIEVDGVVCKVLGLDRFTRIGNSITHGGYVFAGKMSVQVKELDTTHPPPTSPGP